MPGIVAREQHRLGVLSMSGFSKCEIRSGRHQLQAIDVAGSHGGHLQADSNMLLKAQINQLESGTFSRLLAMVFLRLSREKVTCLSVCSPVGQVLVQLQR